MKMVLLVMMKTTALKITTQVKKMEIRMEPVTFVTTVLIHSIQTNLTHVPMFLIIVEMPVNVKETLMVMEKCRGLIPSYTKLTIPEAIIWVNPVRFA